MATRSKGGSAPGACRCGGSPGAVGCTTILVALATPSGPTVCHKGRWGRAGQGEQDARIGEEHAKVATAKQAQHPALLPTSATDLRSRPSAVPAPVAGRRLVGCRLGWAVLGVPAAARSVGRGIHFVCVQIVTLQHAQQGYQEVSSFSPAPGRSSLRTGPVETFAMLLLLMLLVRCGKAVEAAAAVSGGGGGAPVINSAACGWCAHAGCAQQCPGNVQGAHEGRPPGQQCPRGEPVSTWPSRNRNGV